MRYSYRYTVTIPGSATLDRVAEVVEFLRGVGEVVPPSMLSGRTIFVNQPVDWRDHGFPKKAADGVAPKSTERRIAFYDGAEWAFTQAARREAEREVREYVEIDGFVVSEWEEIADGNPS